LHSLYSSEKINKSTRPAAGLVVDLLSEGV
jgi:hypothetical protein